MLFNVLKCLVYVVLNTYPEHAELVSCVCGRRKLPKYHFIHLIATKYVSPTYGAQWKFRFKSERFRNCKSFHKL